MSYVSLIEDLIANEKLSEEILSLPRLGTFEELIHSDDTLTKENRTKLFEDFFEIKHELKLIGNNTNTSNTNNTTSGDLNYESDNSISS